MTELERVNGSAGQKTRIVNGCVYALFVNKLITRNTKVIFADPEQTSPNMRAQLLSQSFHMSGYWLRATLAIACQRYTDQQFTLLFRLRACLPFQTSHPEVTADDLMSSNDYGHNATIASHNVLRDILASYLQKARFTVLVERASNLGLGIIPDFYCPRYARYTSPRAIPDIPRPTIFDVTISHPSCQAYVTRGSARQQGSAAADAARAKLTSYIPALAQARRQDLTIVPLAFESYGFVSSAIRSLLSTVSRRIAVQTGLRSGRTFHDICTRIICLKQKMLAMQLQEKFQDFLSARHPDVIAADTRVPDIYITPENTVVDPVIIDDLRFETEAQLVLRH